ncbi:hypothetical protein [Flavobacterium reichenbachii]|uniref:Lipoprotein n=1 Tax=Flavobacterium reichenbachii TaxID=362418 RepID=A0A085ZK92_9FLAO|nr:hypothetical protein [Flavobacterium reichenbachii]KFF04856.1 hypothetical protein IW19_04620 [Flavobacterium reichenbachii]OXB12157.1 hypothetical protein B0A68_19545 [Flavobacterium reichenbachii]
MKIILKFTALIALITCSGCHFVGEDLIEVPVKDEITSSGEISLKKGETVVFWTKINANTAYPEYSIKYLIEENNKTVEFDSISRFTSGRDHIINAKASSGDAPEKTSIYKESFEFELENKKFTAPKDGKYTFDFKLTKFGSESEAVFNSDMSIILRK